LSDSSLNVDSVPRVRMEVRFRKVRGTVLVAANDQTLELTETAAFSSGEIDGVRAVSDIGAALAREYEIPEEMAIDDTVSLIADLIADDIVELVA